MIKVGIVGGTGYTGIELIRLLHAHPQVEITAITSRSEAGRSLSELVPSFFGLSNLTFQEPSLEVLSNCELIFFATPNGTAMKMTPQLLAAGKRVIDLAADFRIKDVETWQQWYGEKHACPDLVDEAVYGLPELNRSAIKDARLIANPGCYPTSVILGFLPLLEKQLVDPSRLIADTKSGVSGAGRGANVGALHSEVSENFKAYGIGGHRHLPEISAILSSVLPAEQAQLTFVPHLLPMNRGIHATLYAFANNDVDDLTALYRQRYENEAFVTVLDAGMHPETRAVRATNHCVISVNRVSKEQVVVLSVIDNLVKGAAGQAIQNMNIMCGLSESLGIEAIGLLP
ncbi:MAG: N-acetyl-gamma-glutamyl-phosphate reductase [Gammaproteobacteria bacterium]